ncbi:MAG: acetate/propionate family kinase [Desulfobacteraceae bacterium]|nr:acetate/propionate family kinase [Desulfobacteraceae bacterium]
MKECIAVINAGSSSIKFSVFTNDNSSSSSSGDDSLELIFKGQVDGIGVAPKFEATAPDGTILASNEWANHPDVNHKMLLDEIIQWAGENLDGREIRAVGHRVVHGGKIYSKPVLVDESVLQTLETFVALAPLHQPHNLVPIKTLAQMDPYLFQVACFDTAFHTTMPDVARNFALPRNFTQEGVHRYGFHGLSYEYIANKLPSFDLQAAKGRAVVAHLGSGASMCAMLKSKSIASTMGFTAIDGLPMGTRTGSLDPGVVLYLMRQKHMDTDDIERLLYKESGMLGISGISNDMRVLMKSDDPRAKEAVDIFVYRVKKELAGLVAALEGIDTLVFTAGIGENSPQIREQICQGLQWLGIRIDSEANRRGKPRISTSDSDVSVWVIPTNEELMIAMHTRKLMVQNTVYH